MTVVNLAGYLAEDESPLRTAEVRLREVGAIDGTLACTDTRLVFVAEDGVTDIAVGEVTALEYREASFPLWSAVTGVVFAIVGLFLLLVAWTGAGVPVTTWLGAGLFVLGVASFAVGAYGRAATLEVHTPAKSFEFTGSEEELSAFPTCIRSAGKK